MNPAYLGEFIGTMILVLLGDGVVANVVLKKTKGNDSGWIVITAGWGFAVMMGVYCVNRLSGAHLNPAVTLALAATGAFKPALIAGYIAAQMAGAFVGAVLVWLAYMPHFAATEDQGSKLGVFCTGPGIRNAPANFICEFIGTALLLFAILSIGANGNTHGSADAPLVFGTHVQPLLVGFLIWSIGLSLGGPTGYSLNPARDLAPRIAHLLLPIPGKGGSDWGYSWVPVLGPIAGAIAGAALFKLTGF